MKERNKMGHTEFGVSQTGMGLWSESGGVIWIGTCSVACNVERCAKWNEVECGL